MHSHCQTQHAAAQGYPPSMGCSPGPGRLPGPAQPTRVNRRGLKPWTSTVDHDSDVALVVFVVMEAEVPVVGLWYDGYEGPSRKRSTRVAYTRLS